MKYYLIAGEASGDLHASNLMAALKKEDPKAVFRFYGGDKMAAVGGTLVKHYKELAYMGFIPVLTHLPTILTNMKRCKKDIEMWCPDVVILVDYPGFNLDIAKFVHERRICKVFYYISPKIWAWKEYRIKNIRRDVDELFSILPFEVKWFADRNYPIHYVGNPCVDAVFRENENDTAKAYDNDTAKAYDNGNDTAKAYDNGNDTAKAYDDDTLRYDDDTVKAYDDETLRYEKRKQIAILAGSRKQEIKDNLGRMLEAASTFKGYKLVIAGAPNFDHTYYNKYIPKGMDVEVRFGETYNILRESCAALVTSGTATLETAILRVPQVVCYYSPAGKFFTWLKGVLIKVKYVSLVNLVVDREIVPELILDKMTKENIIRCLGDILPGGKARQQMLDDYEEMNKILGGPGASERAAKGMVKALPPRGSSSR